MTFAGFILRNVTYIISEKEKGAERPPDDVDAGRRITYVSFSRLREARRRIRWKIKNDGNELERK